MLLLVDALPSVDPLQAVVFALAAIITVACLTAMEIICRRDRVRRAGLDVFGRAVQTELAESGYRALFGCPVVFCIIVVLLMREGGAMVQGLIAGGLIGLTLALGVPTRAIAWVRPDYVKKMSPEKRRLHQEIRRRRNVPAVLALATPLFLGFLATGDLMEVGYAHDPEQAAAIGFLLGLVQFAALAWGVQAVQVLRSLANSASPPSDARRQVSARPTQRVMRAAILERLGAPLRAARGWKPRSESTKPVRD